MAPSNKKSTIHALHVDDDPSILEITKQIMMDMDNSFEFDDACSVDEAFKKLSTKQYDIIISDYEMPQKDGLQFLKELREQKNETPFILFTGKGREEIAIKALNLGADGYHNKQGSPETVYGELAHSINLIVERYKIKEALREQDIRFAKLAAQTPGMLYQFLRRPNGTYCVPFTSDGIYDIFGCSPQDVKEDFSPITKVIVPEDLEKVVRSIEYSAAHLSLWQCEYRIQLSGQKIRWLWGQSAPEKLEDGSILWNGFNTDITERKNAEEELRETFEVLERAGEGIDAGLAVIGKDYSVVWANKHLMDLGVAPNKKCYQTFNHSQTICTNCGAKKIFEQNLPLDIHEFETINPKGETTWIELRVTPLKDKNGNVTAALELAVPITERKQAEDKLRQSQFLTQKILYCSPNLIYIYDLLENCNVYTNREVLDFLGYTSEQVRLMGSGLFDSILHPDDAKVVALHHARFKNALDSEVHVVEYRMKHSNGEWRWLRSRDVLFARTKEGLGKQILGICEDITEHKKMQEDLKVREEKFRSAFAIVPNAVYICTLKEGKMVEVNERFEEIFGYTRQEIIGQTSLQLGLWANPSDREKMLTLLKSNGKVRTLEIYCVRKNGQIFPAQFSVSVLQADDQQLLVGVIRDSSSYRQTEEALKESEEKFRNLAEESPNMIFINHKGKVVYANKKCEETLGYTKTEFYSAEFSFLSLISPEYIETLKTAFTKHTKGEEVPPYEYTLITRNGKRIDAIITTKLITYKNDRALLGIVTDITERKKMEEALAFSERKYREFAESLPEIIFEIDVNGNLVFFNQKASQITGYSIDEFGANFSFIRLIVPAEQEKVMEKIRRLMSGKGFLSGEFHIIRKDGSVFPAMVWANPILVQNKFAGLRGIVADISEHKRAEDELKQAAKDLQLLNEKLRVVGSLTRHDVRNKLMVAKSNSYLLKKRLGDRPELAEYLDGIDAAFASSDKLVEFSHVYEKIGAEKPEIMNVAECFNVAAALFSNLSTVKIANECQEIDVVADSLLIQLFYNLIDNSSKHGEKVTQIRLHYTKDGKGVKLFYEDNGVGISEANKPKLFEVGFTTGKGSGLGLSLVKKMIEVYGWTITEVGEPGKGAKFTITIPRINKEATETLQNQTE